MTLYQADPHLRLVDDCKLKAVNTGSGQLTYGSKEDDKEAMKSLSAIQLTEIKSKEAFANMIVQNLGKSPDVIIHCPLDAWSVSSMLLNMSLTLTLYFFGCRSPQQ